jgi:hypothetical protein
MSNWLKSLLSLVFMAIMLGFGFQQTQAPQARFNSDLDYAELSNHVARIASKPHPMGSEANREVRDYIVTYFQSLGLATEVQKATVVYKHPSRESDRTIIANVENIIARLPGKSMEKDNQANDLVLMGHYDSRPLTPGAADDASGTAVIMETARLMVDGPTPVRDVVFLITDGEEMGLLGAQGFFRQHPAASDVGLVLDFEARGSTGASTMFETSENNAWLVGQLIESAPDLVASSLSYEIYRRMPNDTDMSISKGEGVAGLNFGFVSGLFDYHAMTDTPENLDKNTLAQQANYALATTRHFAHLEDWQEGTNDVTYFNLWRGTLVSYSQNAAVVSGVLVLLFGLWVFVSTKRAGVLKVGSLASGLLALLVLVIVTSIVFESMIDFQQATDDGIARLVSLGEWPLLAYFVTTLGICVWFSAAIRRGLNYFEAIVPALTLAVLSLVAGRPWYGALILALILLPSMVYLRARKNTPDLWGAALLVWWLLTAMALYLAPNGAYLLVWPLASVLLGFIIQRKLGPVDNEAPAFSTLVVSFLPLLLLVPLIIMAYLALGTYLPQVIMVISVLSMLLVWPLIQNVGPAANRVTGLLLLISGLAMIWFVMFERDFDARYPQEQSLFYAFDMDKNESYWVSPDVEPGSWLEQHLGRNADDSNMTRILPGYEQDILIRENGEASVEAATLDIRSERLVEGQREITLQLKSPSGAEYINLLFQGDVPISSASVNGFELKVPQSIAGDKAVQKQPEANKNKDKTSGSEWWRWRWYGLPDQGAEIVLKLEPGKALKVKIVEVDYGMPESAPVRPVGSMARKYTWSDSKVIYQTRVLD